MDMTPNVTFKRYDPNLDWFHPPDGGEVYVLTGSEGLVLVDSGLGRHRQALQTAMAEAGIDPADIRLAVASHFHCDHVGDMGWWQRAFDLPVVAHRMAVEPMGKPDPVVTGAEIPFSDWKEPFEPCDIAHVVEGGETFEVGDLSVRVEAAPGHSVSGLHLFCGDWVFVGDNLFESGGIGWMDIHWGSNPETYIESLERLRPHCGKQACAGHGAPFEIKEEILSKAIEVLRFHIPPEHGMGIPRP
jgi:glyoxylase-like metal-dependent hydrolase (beta-lactamase superfamily II)